MKGRSLRVEKPQVPPLRSPGFPIGVGALANFMRLSLESSTGVADPWDMKRGISCPRQKVQQIPGCPILCAFRKGWDTTNLDTGCRVSHPLQMRKGWGTRLFVVLHAVPNTNRGLIENLFLIRKPHEARGTPRPPVGGGSLRRSPACRVLLPLPADIAALSS